MNKLFVYIAAAAVTGLTATTIALNQTAKNNSWKAQQSAPEAILEAPIVRPSSAFNEGGGHQVTKVNELPEVSYGDVNVAEEMRADKKAVTPTTATLPTSYFNAGNASSAPTKVNSEQEGVSILGGGTSLMSALALASSKQGVATAPAAAMTSVNTMTSSGRGGGRPSFMPAHPTTDVILPPPPRTTYTEDRLGPLGEGLWTLIFLAGAYTLKLLRKRKNND